MATQLKRKTAMVLHQIEESLGSFVQNNGSVDFFNSDRVESINKREADKGRVFNKESIKDVIEATYLDELFGFAIDITKDSSIENSINYLYSLFHHLDIYEVRNAISHPNRTFLPCYWYRIASIATDPVNDVLGLAEIKETFVAAENNLLQDPPEEWVNKIIWEIPNNLPSTFDHGLTGLIGRVKEISELSNFISNPRINTIALVAAGGTGKTALALDLLNSIVSNPSYSKSVDSVIYVTMKTEKLTASGIVSLNAIETIDELCHEVLDAINDIYNENFLEFETAIASKSEQKILLCIDNLETLLRDNHFEFEKFNLQLPSSWQVLVTSRVVISNATVLSLPELKQKSAIHLARKYMQKRGVSSIEEKDLLKLTSACFYNPLAIRLTIDLVNNGGDMPRSLNMATKGIAAFSYNNLIESLSINAVEILETIFVEGMSSRFSLCNLLQKSLDEVSSAIGELSKTSLIIRNSSDEGEMYKLSDSVKELLIISPRNISVRSSVQKTIHQRRELSNEIDIRQAEKELPAWHVDYIPSEVNENLKILLTEVVGSIKKARKNSEIAIKLYLKVKEAGFMYEDNYLYHKFLARLQEILKDYNSAEFSYKKALDINASDASTKYLLGRMYHNTKRYSEASQIYKKIIESGICSSDYINESYCKSIFTGYFLALLYSGNYEVALNETENWKNSGPFRGLLGSYRAAAWKRKMENTVDSNPEETVEALIKSSRILSEVFKTEGYFNAASNQAYKLFEEIEFCFSRVNYCQYFVDEGIELLAFISQNLRDVVSNERNYDFGEKLLISKLNLINLPKNPFKNSEWTYDYDIESNSFDESHFADLIEVKVSKKPTNRSYIFAIDPSDQEYFLHFSNLRNGSWPQWINLSLGDNLKVKPSIDIVSEDQAQATCDIFL